MLLVGAGIAAYLVLKNKNKEEQEYIAPASSEDIDIDIEEAGADNNSETGGQSPTSMNDSANPLPTGSQEEEAESYDTAVFEQVDVDVSAKDAIATNALASFTDYQAGAVQLCQVNVAMSFIRTAGSSNDVTNISATFGHRYKGRTETGLGYVKKPIGSWNFQDLVLDEDRKNIQFSTRFMPADYGIANGWRGNQYYIDLCYRFDNKEFIDTFYFDE